LDKLQMLIDLKSKDPQTLRNVTANLNIFENKFKKMTKEELKNYIEEIKNQPKKKLIEDRISKLKKLFKG